jgi:SAM-dependent methyltransferase
VAATESILGRPLRSLLDIGCGEGRWQPVLRKLRPRASYLGIDPSEYAVSRFGARRNLRSGSFEKLELHVFDYPFDLVVCSDVLHYLSAKEIRRGVGALVELTGGVALLEVFTSADEFEGDTEGFHRRAPGWYRRLFEEAGLAPIGLQMYVPAEVAETLNALDLSVPARRR